MIKGNDTEDSENMFSVRGQGVLQKEMFTRARTIQISQQHPELYCRDPA